MTNVTETAILEKPSVEGANDVSTYSTNAAWRGVSLLSLLYVFCMVDRYILVLLIGPIKSEFGVTDFQLGLLIGPAFALFYGSMGLPMARLADHSSRHRLISLTVLVWACCTIGSAMASTFTALVVLRIGLATAEAALNPAAYSMIGNMFPRDRRAFATSVYTAIGMAGTSGAYLLGTLVLAIAGSIALQDSGLSSPWRVVASQLRSRGGQTL